MIFSNKKKTGLRRRTESVTHPAAKDRLKKSFHLRDLAAWGTNPPETAGSDRQLELVGFLFYSHEFTTRLYNDGNS
jgi:hypothetical protein